MLRFLRPFRILLTVKSGKHHKIGLLSAIILTLALFSNTRIYAQTWQPAGGGDWNTASNWSPAVVPGAGADVVIPAGHTGGTITGVPNVTLNSLTVSGSGNCTFSGAAFGNRITISGSFVLNSGKTLTIGDGGGRMNFTIASTGTGAIRGTLVINASAFQDRDFTNDGNLTIGAGGLVTGAGESNFFNNSGATLQIGSPQGITLTAMSGSVQMTGSVPNRVYSTGASYAYIGNANQAVGDGLPATVVNLSINNTGGGGNNTVTLASSISIGNQLLVENGVFALGANNVTSVSSLEMTGTSITGTGTITLAGDVISNVSAATALISAPIALGSSLRSFKISDGMANPDLSVSSVISGTGGISKAGDGVLFLSASNTYSGGTFIESGTVRLGNSNALNSGAVTFTAASTGVLQLNGNSTTVSALNTNVTVGTPVIENGAGAGVTLTVNSTAANVFAGTIQNGGAQTLALTKSNSGSLTLSGTNTYSGGTNLTGGTLNINNPSAIGTGTFSVSAGVTIDNTSSGAITLSTNNAQNWNGDFTFTGTQNLNLGTGSVTLVGSNRQVTTSGGVLTVGGIISGGFRLTKTGAGTLTLSGANTHSGTTLSAGTLNINNATALGATASTFIINGGTIDNTTGGAITTGNYPQTWAGDFAFTGTQDLNLGTGAVTLSANRQVTTNAGNLTVGGVISGGFSLTKSGAGTLTLAGANIFTGGTILNAGTLNINSSGALGTTAGTFIINGGTIDNTTGGSITTLNYAQNWNGDFIFTGTQNLNLGTGPVTLSSNRQVTVSANTLTVGGTINAPGLNLTKTGVGSLVLGNNPVTLNSLAINAGSFTSTSGTLTIGGSLTNSGTFNNNNGTVLYNGASPQTVAGVTYYNLSFSGAGQKNAIGAVNVTNNLVNASVFDVSGFTLAVGGTINNAGGTIRFAGVSNGLAINTGTIEYYGSGQLVAAGTYENLTINQSSGEAQLAGDVTVTGVLTISNGNLNLAGNNLLLGSAASVSISSPSASRMIIASGGSEVIKTYSGTGIFTFPIGDNTGAPNYSPITVEITSASGFPGTVHVSVDDFKHPNNVSPTHFITRYWNVSTSLTSVVANITASYPSVDINGTETSINAAQLQGVFNQVSNPWIKFTPLGANTLSATGAALLSGGVNAFTGITGANPTVSITGGGVTICEGGSVSLNSTVTGDPTIVYEWSPAAGLSATNIPNPVATPVVTTNYTLTIRDGNGITSSDNTTITVTPKPATPVVTPAGPVEACEGTASVVLNSSAATGNQWYRNGSMLVGETGTTLTITTTPANNGNYSVISTVSGCSSNESNIVIVTITPSPTVNAGSDSETCQG
ncbi:MAG: beta strand repeat-containing protein, partial [Cyclobacteriaceae bacterium]